MKQNESRLEAGATKKASRIMGATRSRGYLPHREGKHPIYFVTFRLVDSLPRDLVLQLRRERENSMKIMPASESAADRTQRSLLRRAERCLDTSLGECHMREARVAEIVADAIQHFDGRRYKLLAWCVMPNHVHVVFCPFGDNTLDGILHSWKSFSALMANRLLRRRGNFWQREYFDHLVRTEGSLLKIIRYVKENPGTAGLRNWRWAGPIS